MNERFKKGLKHPYKRGTIADAVYVYYDTNRFVVFGKQNLATKISESVQDTLHQKDCYGD